MSFVVEIAKTATVKQGLPSTVQTAKDQPRPAVTSFDIIIKVGIMFTDKQLTKKGWYIDTDVMDEAIAKQATYLASDTWTSLFNFPPTFEMVSKWMCEQLKPLIKQLEYVELENKTLGVTTQYIP